MTGQQAVGISKFLRNKKILITGATGLVGKCVVEKLIRDDPDLNKLYLLIRPKQGESSLERSRKYFNSVVFDRVQHYPQDLVQFVQGDVTFPECGLNAKDKELLRDVDIVLHSAGDKGIGKSLPNVLAVNSEGTKNLLDLAVGMKNVQSFVSISTAFSTPNETQIEEKLHPANWEQLQAMEQFSFMSPEWSKKLSKAAIGQDRTPYQYSKQLAENVVQSYRNRLPVCIVRPGIVISASSEPYLDGNETNTAISIHPQNIFTSPAYHTALIRAKYQFAVTPIDTLVNTTIAAAWRQSTTSSPNFLVYNCVAPPGKGLTNQELITWGVESMRKDLPLGLKYHPTGSSTSYYSVYLTNQVLFPFIPSLVYNTVVHLIPKRRLKDLLSWNIMNRIMGGLFSAQEWKFSTNNMKELNELMTQEDRQRFPIDFTQIDWKALLFQNFAEGPFKFGPPPKKESKTSNIMR